MPSPKRPGPRPPVVKKPAKATIAPAKAAAKPAEATAAAETVEDTDAEVDSGIAGAEGAEVEDSAADDTAADASKAERPSRRRRSWPTAIVNPTQVVAAVLVALLAVGTWLLLTRPTERSAIELTAFDEILSAARSGIVDVTSFDYLTIDQDLARIEDVTTGDLRGEVLAALAERRDRLVTDQQVSSTEVIAASLTEASPSQATALIVLRARQMSLLTPQETVTRYRVEVSLEFVDGRWLLSGLTGR